MCCHAFTDWLKKGLTLGTIAAIASAWFAIISYQQSIRPYIGPADLNIDQGGMHSKSLPDGTFSDFRSLIELPIKNYGDLPAYFESEYSSYTGKTDSKGITKSYIMPDQIILLTWTEQLTSNDCYKAEERKIEIQYGKSPSDLEYSVTLKPKLIKFPTKGLLNDFVDAYELKQTCYDGSGSGNYTYSWYIPEMHY